MNPTDYFKYLSATALFMGFLACLTVSCLFMVQGKTAPDFVTNVVWAGLAVAIQTLGIHLGNGGLLGPTTGSSSSTTTTTTMKGAQ